MAEESIFKQNSLHVLEPRSVYDSRLKTYVNYDDRDKAQIYASDNII